MYAQKVALNNLHIHQGITESTKESINYGRFISQFCLQL